MSVALPRRHRSRRPAGFTLLELLLALTLLGMLLLVFGRVLISSYRASQLGSELFERDLLRKVATDVVRYDVRLAGYLGSGSPVTMAAGLPTLAVERGRVGDSDEIQVRYLEDRYLEPPRLREITFSVAKDSRNVYNLYRREGSGRRQPAVAGVSGLTVVGVLTPSGAVLDPLEESLLHRRVTALVIELTFSWGEAVSFVVPLEMPQVPVISRVTP